VGVGIVQFEAKFNLEGKVILQNTTKLKNWFKKQYMNEEDMSTYLK
jgi:hypothetical protein